MNLADVWPTITRVGCATSRTRAGRGMAGALGSTQVAASERVQVAPPGSVRVAPRECWTALSYVYSESTTTEGCHGARVDEHST